MGESRLLKWDTLLYTVNFFQPRGHVLKASSILNKFVTKFQAMTQKFHFPTPLSISCLMTSTQYFLTFLFSLTIVTLQCIIIIA